jgi:hypothetical protein
VIDVRKRHRGSDGDDGIRQPDAHEKLLRGQPVNIAEIVETYCELVSTPMGKVPGPRCLQTLKRHVAEAAERGLLIESPAGSAAATDDEGATDAEVATERSLADRSVGVRRQRVFRRPLPART